MKEDREIKGHCICARLCVFAFALAAGIVWGLGSLVMGLLAWKMQWGVEVVKLMSSLYVRYDATLEGSLWGGLWGFVDGFIGGLLLAVIYNMFRYCCCKARKCNPES